MWLTVNLAVTTLLLQPWLKADVAPCRDGLLRGCLYILLFPGAMGFKGAPAFQQISWLEAP